MTKFRSLSLIIALFLCSSCSTADTKSQEEVDTKPKQLTKKTNKDGEPYELAVGDDLNEFIANFEVKTIKGKKKKIKDLLGSDSSLISLVKPGCIFCKSMLAMLDATSPKIKPEMIIVLDQQHASFAEFKEEAEAHKNIKATWIYDFDNKLHNELGMVSFPRMMHIDKNNKVLQAQTGLVLPEDQSSLDGKAFPVVLQKLSETTIAWMQNL